MSFLYPSFLWALGVLAIPIVIHLFNFRRTRQIYFSNTRFLRQVKEVTRAKRRLKHFLILASRLLFLSFLVLAFAQPVIPAKDQLGARTKVIIYLDNSLSMSAQLEDKTRALDAGIQFTESILRLFPQNTRYKLITNDFAPYSNTFKTKVEVSDLLTQVRLSSISREATEIKNRVQQDENSGAEVFWISDYQQSTFGKPDLGYIDSTFRWHLVPLSPLKSDNVFIDSAYLSNPFAVGEEKNSLRVRVRNDGGKEVRQLNLKLTINHIQAATASVNISPGSVQETSFDLIAGLKGLNEAEISFNDFPISFDNDFYLSLNFNEKITVLEIRPNDQVTPIEQVFGNKDVFSFRSHAVTNLNYSLVKQADLVVINGLNVIDPSLVLTLQEFLNNFGTLVIIPGPDPDTKTYTTLINVAVSKAQDPKVQALDLPDFNNPFYENVFEEKSTSVAMPEATPMLNWGMDRTAILKFKTGTPFLSVFEPAGQCYLMACPLQDKFTSLHRNALFVPIMYKIASRTKRNVMKPYHTLDENLVTLKVDTLLTEEPLRLTGEEEIIPSQRKIGDGVLLDLPRYAMTKGFYRVLLDKDTLDLLAFNLSKRESLMTRIQPADLQKMFGPAATLFEATTSEAFTNEIKDRYLGISLWKYALLLGLVFLLTEIILIRFMK